MAFLTYMCDKIYKNKSGKIEGYSLVCLNDNTGIPFTTAEIIKRNLADESFDAEITNLILTKDNRLLPKKINGLLPPTVLLTFPKNRKKYKEEELKKLIAKNKLMGKTIIAQTYLNQSCYLLQEGEHDYLLYIPDYIKRFWDNTVTRSREVERSYDIFSGFQSITCDGKTITGDMFLFIYSRITNLRIIGGKNLEQYEKLFSSFRFLSLDLRGFHTERADTLVGLFQNSEFKYLDMSTLKIPNIEMAPDFMTFKADTLVLNKNNTVHKQLYEYYKNYMAFTCKRVEWVEL